MSDQRKRGRPVKRGSKAGAHLHLRVDAERKRLYAAAAGARGVSDWAIDKLDSAVLTSVVLDPKA